jgi:hypothetical protein
MTATLTPNAKQQFFDANGNPLAGGKLYTYIAGTTSPTTTYVDSAGVTTNTNPIILDSRGEANVWLGTGTYKFKLLSATDVEIWTVDNIVSPTAGVLATLAASDGSSLVGFIQAGTGAVATTVQTKLRESVSVLDFGADPTGASDSATAFTTALTAAIAANKTLCIPSGTYLIGSTISPTYVSGTGDPSGRDHTISVIGQGMWSTVINFTGTGYCFNYQTNISASKYLDAVHIEGIQIKTATGGGVAMPAGGGIKFKDYFMNGCAATYWGLLMEGSYDGGVGIYNIDVDNCRFWHNSTNYQGGAISCENFLCFNLSNTFISQQYKDGDICFFGNGRVLNIGKNVMIEGVNAATTVQVGIAIGGSGVSDTIFATNIDAVYFEGRLDTCIKLGSTVQYGVKVSNLFANFYAGKTSPVILDASTNANHFGIEVDGLTYYNADTGAGTDYIINDPNAVVSTRMDRNKNASSSANQLARVWKQISELQQEANVRWGYTSTGIVRQSSSSNIPSTTWHKWTGAGSNFYATRVSTDNLGNSAFGNAAAGAVVGSETITDVFGINRAYSAFQFLNNAGLAATTANLGTQSRATVATPYTWVTVLAPDGTPCYIPLWK